MSKIVSIHSFRGGTGKSNISANVAAQFARKGRRIGVIDTDVQSPGIHVLFGMDEKTVDKALNDYLWDRCAVEEAAYDVTASVKDVAEGGTLFLIPSSIRAGEIAQVLREGYDVGRLSDGFESLVDKLGLDYLFIDTHPGVNEETLLSIAISDILFIVLRPDQQDFQGTAVAVDVSRRMGVPDMYLVINLALSTFNFKALAKRIGDTYHCPVATVLPLAEDVARLQSAGIFSLLHPVHPFTRGIEDIVAVIEALD